MSIDLSLSRLQQLLPHLPPQYTRPTIHIAGTNGKGSVSALVSSILAECLSSSSTRPSIGRFNSPHPVHITDCILVNHQPVSVASYEATRAVVLQADQKYGTKLTPFEILTLTAFQLFEQAAVDIVVVEVEMGGRLDATNVIPTKCILVSALTAVDLDHQGFLGHTVEAIATEKAGIARRGKPFVLGPQSANHRDAVVKTVKSRIEEVGARLCEPVKVEAIEKEALSDLQILRTGAGDTD